jgi:type IV secretory pathway VirB6-like protein
MKKLFLVICYCTCFLFGLSFFPSIADNNLDKYVSECKNKDLNYKPYDYCRNNNNCNDSIKLKFKISNLQQSNKDYYYEGSNPFCIMQGATAYLNVILAETAMNLACGLPVFSQKLKVKNLISLAQTGLVKTGMVVGGSILIDPLIGQPIALAAASFFPNLALGKHILVATALSLTGAGAAPAWQRVLVCTLGIVGANVTALSSYLASTGIMNITANVALKNVRVCGHDWTTWAWNDTSCYQKGAYESSYQHKVIKCFTDKTFCLSIFRGIKICEGDKKFCAINSQTCVNENCPQLTAYHKTLKNKIYREYLYNGKEYINSDIKDGTIDPRLPKIKGYQGIEQRYYLRGNEIGNYACSRFYYAGGNCVDATNTEVTDSSKCKEIFAQAYKKCLQRSFNTICIEDTFLNTKAFCRADEVCGLSGIIYSAYHSIKEPGKKVCVRSYSLCPYNFNIAGGTEKKDLYCDGDYLNIKDECNTDDLKKIWVNGIIPTDKQAGKLNVCYGQTKNFCQYNAHCTYIPTEPYIYKSTTFSRFFDPACKNFIGDSRNIMDVPMATGQGSADNFGNIDLSIDMSVENLTKIASEVSGLNEYQIMSLVKADVSDSEHILSTLKQIIRGATLPLIDIGKYRGFTAPIVQCVRESLLNMFDNRAGLSKCADPTMELNEYGLCGSDTPWKYNSSNYEGEGNYKAGDPLPKEENIFYKIQNAVRNIIKLIAVFFIMIGGYKILISGEHDFLEKQEKARGYLLSLFKLALVFYFATGTAWQNSFYKLLNNSVTFAYSKVFVLAGGYDSMIISSKNNTEVWSDKYDGCYFKPIEYPEGKEYLSIFDTLDCKLAKYLGYGPEVNIPNIILFIITCLISSGIGTFIFIFAFFFFIMILGIAVKTVYIFLISFIAINILIFLSPIIFPTLLFNKTKEIFDSWLTNLMGFALQPILLMIFVALYLAVFDKIALGDAKFKRDFNNRNAILDCRDVNSQKISNSLVCLFHIAPDTPIKDAGGFFSAIGMNIKVIDIDNFLTMNDKSILMSLIVFCVITYVFYHIMGKITSIASNLFGGQELSGGDMKFDTVIQAIGGVTKNIDLAAKGLANAAIEKRSNIEKPKPKKPEDTDGEGIMVSKKGKEDKTT